LMSSFRLSRTRSYFGDCSLRFDYQKSHLSC